VIEVVKSDQFEKWFRRLRDRHAKAKIEARIRRLSLGNPGDVKSVGGGILEMRIDHGPGYRVYFVEYGELVVVLLCGGDKSSQPEDIKLAREIAHEWKE
jgi:putative addiction module killer protein